MMKTKFKLLAAGGMLMVIVAAMTASYQWGSSTAERKAAERHAQALDEYRQRMDREHERALTIQKRDHERALRSAQQNIEVITQTEEVIKYVDREIRVPFECRDLSIDVVRVLQQTNDIIHRAAKPAEDPG